MKSMMTVLISALSLLVTLLLLSVAVSGSFAKCRPEPYIISGRVIEEKTKNPIIDAQIFLFFDNYDSTWSSGHDTKYPDYFKTNSSGEFEATMFFAIIGCQASVIRYRHIICLPNICMEEI